MSVINLRHYMATYSDGTTYKLMACGVKEAVMTAAELNKSPLVRIVPVGEW